MTTGEVTRRQFLAACACSLLFAGCGAGPNQAATTSGGAQSEWDRSVTAAKQEGKVNVIARVGSSIRQIFEPFTQRYGIQVELLQMNGQNDVLARLDPERKAGQFLWDVMLHSAPGMYTNLRPLGALDPLAPALILPEAIDSNKWRKGFADGWMDNDQKWVYATAFNVSWSATINRAFIPDALLNKLDQLWDPQWKGKFVWRDPTVVSSGGGVAAVLRQYKGEDKLLYLLKDQQPVLTQDPRQMAEWMVRGQYPIGIGFSPTDLVPLQQAGVDVSKMVPLKGDDPAVGRFVSSNSSVGIMNRAPHPNAAKVLANWLLTKDGQTAHSKFTGTNSRRLDVPVVSEDSAPEPGREYPNTDRESTYPNVASTRTIVKTALAK